MLGMWDVGDVECSGYRMFGMSNVGCGMFIYKMATFYKHWKIIYYQFIIIINPCVYFEVLCTTLSFLFNC